MYAMQVNDETRFRKNNFNVFEPQKGDIMNPLSFDLVIVPLLAFDKNGNRVGFGKGYYDQFLAQCRSTCIKIGFSYFEPIDSIEDTHEFDVPLDLCVTPTTVYAF
jgi:5-formyltetrahydrofolate cyclo-ligase